MKKRNVKWNLYWDEGRNWLHWGPLALAHVEKVQKPYGPCLRIDGNFEDILDEEGNPAVFLEWEDMENLEGDHEFFILDDGTAHERLKEIYARVLDRGGFEIEYSRHSPLSRFWNRLRFFFGK